MGAPPGRSPGRNGVPDLDRRVDRLARLHVTRADPRQGRDRRGGRLLPRRGPRVRGDGHTALPGRLLGGAALQGGARAARAGRAHRRPARGDRGLPRQGPRRPPLPGRDHPAPRPRGRRGPAGVGRLAAGRPGGTGEPVRGEPAQPGGGGRPGGRPGGRCGLGPGGLQQPVGRRTHGSGRRAGGGGRGRVPGGRGRNRGRGVVGGGGSVPASGTSPGGPAAASGPSAGGPAAGDGAPAGVSVPASGTPAGVSVPTPGSPPGVFVPDPGTPAGGPSGAGAVTGTFGPPPVMPPVKPPSDGARTDTGVPEPRHALDHGPAGSGVPHPPTQPGDRGTGDPGRLSVSVSAASTPGAGGRGRRVSCTVALAVAGALAAVTVGSVFVFDLLPGASRVADSGEGPSGDRPSASQPSGTVPAAYLGTWEGQAASRDSISIPLGTFRVTLTQARVGERVGTLRHTDLFGGICDDVLTLKEVTAQRIVTTSVGAGTNRGVCNQARHTVRLTPVGDDLVYESDSKESGSPKARLSKIE
ncbi:hypothetical protein O1157_20280 [Streptomyces albogriseolus]